MEVEPLPPAGPFLGHSALLLVPGGITVSQLHHIIQHKHQDGILIRKVASEYYVLEDIFVGPVPWCCSMKRSEVIATKPELMPGSVAVSSYGFPGCLRIWPFLCPRHIARIQRARLRSQPNGSNDLIQLPGLYSDSAPVMEWRGAVHRR